MRMRMCQSHELRNGLGSSGLGGAQLKGHPDGRLLSWAPPGVLADGLERLRRTLQVRGRRTGNMNKLSNGATRSSGAVSSSERPPLSAAGVGPAPPAPPLGSFGSGAFAKRRAISKSRNWSFTDSRCRTRALAPSGASLNMSNMPSPRSLVLYIVIGSTIGPATLHHGLSIGPPAAPE